jgi:ferrous iron transport protein B
MQMAQQENSYLGRIGKGINPVLKPLGFNWKMSIGLLSGVAAKEVVISTFNVLYKVDTTQTNNTVSTATDSASVKKDTTLVTEKPSFFQRVQSFIVGLFSPDDTKKKLGEKMKAELNPDGTPSFTPAVALSLMLFILIYFPCIATIVTIKNESGSWKWALFSVCYTLTLAWIVSFAAYHLFSYIL